MEYYSSIKKSGFLPFVDSCPTWVGLEIIVLSEISQREILYVFTYVWNRIKQNNQLKAKLIDTGNRLLFSRGEGEWVEY